MPLSESSNWNDLLYWNDTEVYGIITETVDTIAKIMPIPSDVMTIIKDVGRFDLRASGAITSDTELAAIIPAGYMLDKVVVIETAGNACTVKGGNASAGSQWWGATACGASGITNIPVSLVLSATAAQSVFLTFTAGAGYSIDIYLTIVKII